MVDKLKVLRSLDKLDRLGVDGVRKLLTVGRTDESGVFTTGCGLSNEAAERLILLITAAKGSPSNSETIQRIRRWIIE